MHIYICIYEFKIKISKPKYINNNMHIEIEYTNTVLGTRTFIY